MAELVGAVLDSTIEIDQSSRPSPESVARLARAVEAHGTVAWWWREMAMVSAAKEHEGADLGLDEMRKNSEPETKPKKGARRG